MADQTTETTEGGGTDGMVTMQFDGRDVQVPSTAVEHVKKLEADLRGDYTKKTQELSTQRTEFQTQQDNLQKDAENLNRIWETDPAQLGSYELLSSGGRGFLKEGEVADPTKVAERYSPDEGVKMTAQNNASDARLKEIDTKLKNLEEREIFETLDFMEDALEKYPYVKTLRDAIKLELGQYHKQNGHPATRSVVDQLVKTHNDAISAEIAKATKGKTAETTTATTTTSTGNALPEGSGVPPDDNKGKPPEWKKDGKVSVDSIVEMTKKAFSGGT